MRAAAAAAGRDPDSLTICVAAPAYVGDDLAHQRDQVRWFGGMVGNHVADLVERYGSESAAVPQALTDYIRARKGYDYDHHGKTGKPVNRLRPRRGDRDGSACWARPPTTSPGSGSSSRSGVDQFAVYLMHDQMDETLASYGRDIIPAFR